MYGFDDSGDVNMVWFWYSGDVGIVWWRLSGDVVDCLVLGFLGRCWFSLVFALGRRKITLHFPSQDNASRVRPYASRGKNPSGDVSNLDLVILGKSSKPNRLSKKCHYMIIICTICGQKLLYVQQFLPRCGKTFPVPNSQHWNLTHSIFRNDPEKKTTLWGWI